MKNKNNIAIYQITDVTSFTDIELIKRAIELFGFVNIILDRNNISLSERKYKLNYQDRLDILKYEMTSTKITDYQVIPSDISFQDTIIKNNISDILLDFASEKKTNFELMKKIQKYTYLKPILIKTQGCSDYDFANNLWKYDSSMKLYNRECSQYGFSKFKIKNTRKIGIISENNKFDKIINDTFKDRGYDILNLDENKVSSPQKAIAKKILNSFDKTIVVKYSNMKKDKFNDVFTNVINIKNKDKETFDYSPNDIEVFGNNELELKNNLINVLNSKIKLRLECK